MAQIKLTSDEKIKIIEAINQGLDLSPELLPKMFPRIAEKFDVAALDRAKIPTLEYAGKRTKATILAEAIAGIGAAPLQTVRCFGDASENEWKNMIVQGDNLQFLKTCYKNVDPLIKDKVKGQVKLVYIDPPFATKSDFGGNDGEYSYADKVDRAHFLETLRERLIYLYELLAEDGSIYIHLDQKMSHYVKIIIDEVFGKDNFLNELIWAYKERETSKRFFNRKHDVIFLYVKNHNSNYYFNADKIRESYSNVTIEKFKYTASDGRKYRLRGKDGSSDPTEENDTTYRQYLDEASGPLPRDWFVMPFVNQAAVERTSYPTQKPEELLEKFLLASTREKDLVLDCFVGSGTTGAVAEKLGRRWIGCDFGKHAIYTCQKRILNIAESKKLEIREVDDSKRCEECNSVIEKSNSYNKCKKCGSIYQKEIKSIKEKYGLQPKPFCVVSSGTYDFSHVMDLRKNKETYIDFVLGLFQLARDEEKSVKFRLSNIYTLKDNNPVEVYPVWDDKYLKDVRIDEIYLQSIVDQAGGRLRGDYYIITPESCTNVGETMLKNQDGQDVIFHILSFPYKILEDISQKLTLSEQPSSAENINDLVTSTSFYFNEDVEIEVVRAEDGLKITKFGTKILDGSGNRFEGISGLAMLLVDLDYVPNKPFDMDIAVYAKEISEDGICKVAGLTPSLGIIAIDKHGNESKPFQIK